MGEDDNVFNNSDKILFFGQGPDIFYYDENTFIPYWILNHKKNIYTDTTYYFISFDLGPGKRIPNFGTLNNLSEVNYNVSSYDSYFFHEEDLTNLVNTGRQWFGESFSFDPTQIFNYNVDHLDLTEPIQLTIHVAARSSIGTTFNVNNNSNNIINVYIPYVSTSSNEYYKSTLVEQSFNPTSKNLTISLTYNNFGNSSALAWLDYFRLMFRNQLIFDGNQFLFRDSQSVGENMIANFAINTEFNNAKIWDITDPMNAKNIQLTNIDVTTSFLINTDTLKEFIIFNNTDNFTPSFSGVVSNQNIHGASQPNYIIITHPDFLNAASRLADYHTNVNNENVLLVTTNQVYNEFSTGSQDIGAIRNLVKMFYDKAETPEEIPKNLLLFGDASFDYKNKLYGVSNYVPTYESHVSNSIESSYCTDDYFGVLDDTEGAWDGGLHNSITTDLIDIGIGRIPVSNVNDAEMFVDKVLSYNSIFSRGDWKNKICFVADDADAAWEVNLITHADALAEKIDTTYSYFNVDKIYLDSYQQSLSSGSQRYPDAQEDLVNLIDDGVFIVNYVGHGGEIGWASERILELSDINNFDNSDKLPVFITATCEFTRYDDPTRVSAGEYLLLNPNGGAIGLYSTSRTVAESSTYYLVDALYNYLPDRNLNCTLGEAMLYAKNDPSSGFNIVKRKFSFFGDPNLKLSHPPFSINTTSIELLDSLNQIIPSKSEDSSMNDTINSLSHVRVSGEIVNDQNALVSSFSGLIYMTVFDKSSLLVTLNNDGFLTTPFEYYLQKNVIYNGKVDVLNGLFSFEFIVPKDISYQYGQGKLSYYATDDILGEGTGSNENIFVGGVSDYAISDIYGPTIGLFMNDTNFVSGGYTNNDPELLALLFDESGINTVGTGIGHDLTVILDANTSNQYILNNYYESDLNSYQSGKVVYPFSNLSDGEHTLNFKAWDVHNNSSNAEINFFVTSSGELAITHILNYPNPCSSFTNFVFEHNRPDEMLDIRIDIFSLNGQLIKTISKSVMSTGFRDKSISWNIDDSIRRGIYIYRLSVKSQTDNSISEKTEKLIIVR